MMPSFKIQWSQPSRFFIHNNGSLDFLIIASADLNSTITLYLESKNVLFNNITRDVILRFVDDKSWVEIDKKNTSKLMDGAAFSVEF